MPRKTNVSDTDVQAKQDRCRKYQSYLHHQKKGYIEQLAALLLPAHQHGEDTKVVLRKIRRVFEKKFPERVGQENGCLFRRTIEYGDVRRSIWATCDLSKNFDLFQDKLNKSVKVEVKQENNLDDEVRIPYPAINAEWPPVGEMVPNSGIHFQPPHANHFQPLTQDYLLSPTEQWNLLNALPPRAPSPRPYEAVYPEQRTPFGISFNQQLEYQQAATDFAAFESSLPHSLPDHMSKYPTGPPRPFAQPSTSDAPMNGGSSHNTYQIPPFDPIHQNFFASLNFEHEEAHGWTLAASPPGAPLTNEQKTPFELQYHWE